MTATTTVAAVALAHTAVVVSLVLHTGWPGLAHRAVKMAARVCILFSLSFSVSLFPAACVHHPPLGQRLDTIAIVIVILIVVVVVVAFAEPCRELTR